MAIPAILKGLVLFYNFNSNKFAQRACIITRRAIFLITVMFKPYSVCLHIYCL